MAILPLIKYPDKYYPCSLDLLADSKARAYWLEHLELHLATFEPMLHQNYPGAEAKEKVKGFADDLRKLISDITDQPEKFAPLTILALDQHRQRLLHKYNFTDPYKPIKDKENQLALTLYPTLINELAEHKQEENLILTLIQNLFAGNIFDLGALATSTSYHANDQDFFTTRKQLPTRPWLVDDFDELLKFIMQKRYKNILFFVDNAGADFILGCLPFAKYLAHQGACVTLAANSQPTLNDITCSEVQDIFNKIAPLDNEFDALAKSKRISVIASGNNVPLIDLAEVSDQCAQAAHNCDFLILEGMGRSIESNYHIEFTCPTLKIALLKDKQIASSLNGKIYDQVCRFENQL